MAKVRITYRMEVIIDAEDIADAENKFEIMDKEDLAKESSFVEMVSIEEEEEE